MSARSGLDADEFGVCVALRRLSPTDALREEFSAARPCLSAANPGEDKGAIVYSALTIVDAWSNEFEACQRAVMELIAADSRATGACRIEWIISVSDALREKVAACVSGDNSPFIRVLTAKVDDEIGASAALARLARGQWLIPLEIDERIEGDACQVLDHYFATVPGARCVLAPAAVIDADSGRARYRPLITDSTRLFEARGACGRLIAVSKNLFLSQGGFDEAALRDQRYELALRIALDEPLLAIPECLSRIPAAPSPGATPSTTARLKAWLRGRMGIDATPPMPDPSLGASPALRLFLLHIAERLRAAGSRSIPPAARISLADRCRRVAELDLASLTGPRDAGAS